MFLACDVTADGIWELAPKEDNVQCISLDYRIQSGSGLEYSALACRVRGDKRGQYSGVDVRMGGGHLDGN